MKCPGLHCEGCGKGGGALAVAGVLAVAIIARAAYHALTRSAAFADALTGLVIALGCAVTLATAGTVATLVIMYRRARPGPVLTERPDPAIAPVRMRAEVIGIVRPEPGERGPERVRTGLPAASGWSWSYGSPDPVETRSGSRSTRPRHP